MPYDVFISYAHEDKELRQELEKHLRLLHRLNVITSWTDSDISPGTEWEPQIMEHLNQAKIILLLISADFLNSDFCYSTQMQKAIARHEADEARVIPILLRPVYWKGAPFSKLETLPSGGQAVTAWPSHDQAFEDVVQGILGTVEDLAKKSKPSLHLREGGAQLAAQAKGREHLVEVSQIVGTSEPSVSQAQHPRADVLLVTVTNVEGQAVLDVFKKESSSMFERHFIGDKTYYGLGTINGAKIFMVQSEMGASGPGGAMLTVQAGIQALSPSAVVMVGIAFGVDANKQHIGDILVSQQLLGYEFQKVGRGSDGQVEIKVRGDRPSASVRLLDRFRGGLFDWGEATVRFGLVLSGDKLIDHRDFRDQLRKLESEAIGGEMEGAGLYAAAQRNKVDWIVVKGISDWADGKKHLKKEEHKKLAANNAARFVLQVLQQGGFAVPQQQGKP